MATDIPIRQLKDFIILSDLSPFAMAASADPRLTRTTTNKLSITILNIIYFPVFYNDFRCCINKRLLKCI